ncbi:hypothetical protein [Campylobacter troglodytis]|uniref:hypothetical protein n=1 Tax=Campylobacter troglodytis TaxID=654363 RepID=UPI00115812A8|nr:hypothetical protein [Campylobacter troglodytis]TQR53174.1 hypothetical protein DMC01_11810 [Campylobacter troglodytis]
MFFHCDSNCALNCLKTVLEIQNKNLAFKITALNSKQKHSKDTKALNLKQKPCQNTKARA